MSLTPSGETGEEFTERAVAALLASFVRARRVRTYSRAVDRGIITEEQALALLAVNEELDEEQREREG